MDEVFSEERVKKDNEMGRIIPGGNFLGGNFPGGNFPGGSLMGGNFPRTVEHVCFTLKVCCFLRYAEKRDSSNRQ